MALANCGMNPEAEQRTMPDFHRHMVEVASLFGHVQDTGKQVDQDSQDSLRDVPTAARKRCREGSEALPIDFQGACNVLDLYSEWVPFPKQIAPSDFGIAYKASSYTPRYLETRNPHPRDQFLDFDDASHCYMIRENSGKLRALSGSVTFLASQLAEDFDAAAVLQRMRNGKAWPPLKYTVNSVPVQLDSLRPGSFGLLVEDENGRACLQPAEVEGLLHQQGNVQGWHLAIVQELQRRRGAALSGCQLYRFDRDMSDEEIQKLWEERKVDAANRGTEAHYQIELWLNRDYCRIEEPEVQRALHFLSTLTGMYPGIKAYRTEWRIFAEAEDLAGSIDLALRLPQGTLALIDWKRTSKGKEVLWNRRYDRMGVPLEHMEDCSGAIYALQLNLYRWILESYYGERVSLMAIVSIHPEVEPFFTAVPDLRLEVAYLMAERRARHQRVLMAESKAPNSLRCAWTGQLMTQPVQLENRFYQKACAKRMVQGDLDVQVHEELANAVRNLIEAEPQATAEAETAALLTGRKLWEDLMPLDGLPLNHLLC